MTPSTHRLALLQAPGLPAAALLSLLLGLSGCALAPGMHLGASAPADSSTDTSGVVNGMRVRLRSLTPRTANELSRDEESVRRLPESLTSLKPLPYRLGLYDVITVAVWEHPELSMPLGQYRSDLASGQMVDESGNIFYPYVGMVKARGLTSTELRETLLASLSKVLNNPQLDVKVTGFRSQKVFVNGAVAKPGAVPVTDVPLTLLDAVNQVGGLLPSTAASGSDGSRVELRRDGRTTVVDLFADYGQGADPSQVVLKDGDVVRVPSRDEAKVYVLGEVEKQQALPMDNGRMTLSGALAEAGGLSPLSAEGKGLYVIRLRDSGSVDLYHLDARNPLALALGDRFPLRPRDIVWVDATGLARWNRVIGLILPTASLYYNTMLGTSSTKSVIDDFSK